MFIWHTQCLDVPSWECGHRPLWSVFNHFFFFVIPVSWHWPFNELLAQTWIAFLEFLNLLFPSKMLGEPPELPSFSWMILYVNHLQSCWAESCVAFNLDHRESSRIAFVRKISKRGKGALLLVQSLINVNQKKSHVFPNNSSNRWLTTAQVVVYLPPLFWVVRYYWFLAD